MRVAPILLALAALSSAWAQGGARPQLPVFSDVTGDSGIDYRNVCGAAPQTFR